MKFNKIFISLTVLSTLCFIAMAVLFLNIELKKNALPVLGHVSGFELDDSNSNKFNSSQLKGKVWIACFFFTTCGNICPIMTKNMASLHNAYKTNKDIEFVSISVNPEQDTPEALKKYSQKYQADNKWHFLTGTREAITNLAVGSFKIGSVKEPIFHSANFVLVDRNAQIRGYYDGTVTEELSKLSKDLVKLLNGKNHQSTQVRGMSKEQALVLAKQTEVVQAFYNLKEGALKDCIKAEVLRPCDSNWVTCIEDAWVVKFRVNEECIKPENEQLGVTLLMDSKDGKVISKYPEIDYFKNPLFCMDNSDCRPGDKQTQPSECKNFIYALMENPSANQNKECLCRDSRCVSGKP